MPLIAYDANGDVIATLDYLSPNDPETGQPLGTVDFEAMEAAGMKLRAAWEVNGAVGSGTWPEFLGAGAHEFRVQLEGKKIARLIHHRSEYVRDRDKIEAALAARKTTRDKAQRGVDLLGTPRNPLDLDENGRTRAKRQSERPALLHVSSTKAKESSTETERQP